MQNPLVTLRELTQQTTTNIAKRSEVSKQYISNAERGFYPPKSLNNIYLTILINWAAVEELNLPEVRELYREWQTWKRQQTVEMKQLNLVSEMLNAPVAAVKTGAYGQPKLTSSVGTVFWYRVFSAWRYLHWPTVYGFCADMCCKPYEVDRYESGHCSSMPSTIELALTETHLLKGFNTNER